MIAKIKNANHRAGVEYALTDADLIAAQGMLTREQARRIRGVLGAQKDLIDALKRQIKLMDKVAAEKNITL